MLPLIKKITDEMKSRPKAWRNIAELVISSADKVLLMKLRDISVYAGVSEGSVINFVRSLGYQGFVEFKVALAQERGEVNSRYAMRDGRSLPLILDSAKEALTDAEALDSELPVEVAERLISCARVAVIGRGTSYYIAEIFAGYLTRIGIASFAAQEPLHTARSLSDGDALIAISYSGETDEVNLAAAEASERGAYVAAITSFPSSTLATLADSSLSTPLSESAEGEFPLVARIVQLAVIDALCSEVISAKNKKNK